MTEMERLSEMLNDAAIFAKGETKGMAKYLLEQGIQLPEMPECDPTPTEMVRRLLEKGWEIECGSDWKVYFARDNLEQGNTFRTSSLYEAYHRAFPKKKKRVEVEAWRHKETHRFSVDGKNPYMETSPHYDEWEKGIATFWVEEE